MMKNADFRAQPGPKASRAALTRIRVLMKRLSADLNYATASSTIDYWSEYQSRRGWQSISRKKAECLRLTAGLPRQAELRAIIKRTWAAAEKEHRDRPDPEEPLFNKLEVLIGKIRAELAA